MFCQSLYSPVEKGEFDQKYLYHVIFRIFSRLNEDIEGFLSICLIRILQN
jgi:hypothetical protein